ncbi:ATP-binding protein [Streptomyces sp. NBC_01511]|uniref:sensor histidine kinase n=1 Tax=unclassified Streptomyces TaxID=2593676 RepID=UPI00386B6076
MADGGRVRVGSRTGPGGSAVVEVANSGPVVPPYEVPTLFESFRRLGGQRLATASHGAGPGLSIVRAVARAHGGDVRAEPREGGGTDGDRDAAAGGVRTARTKRAVGLRRRRRRPGRCVRWCRPRWRAGRCAATGAAPR